jgi:hypothetical protein
VVGRKHVIDNGGGVVPINTPTFKSTSVIGESFYRLEACSLKKVVS